jgi:hypothetical protein
MGQGHANGAATAVEQPHGGGRCPHLEPEVCGTPMSGVVTEQAADGALGVRQVRYLVGVHAVGPGVGVRAHEPAAVHSLRRVRVGRGLRAGGRCTTLT